MGRELPVSLGKIERLGQDQAGGAGRGLDIML